MRTCFILIKLLGFACLSVICLPNTTHATTELARINHTVITLEDFNKKYQENLHFFQLRQPTKGDVLQEMIKRELGIQEAKNLKIDKEPEIIDRLNTVLYHALLEKKLNKDFESIHISDDEAKTYYEKNPEIRVSHIFIALRLSASQKEQKEAYDRIKKIQDEHLVDGKMSFAEVAQRYSEGPSAPMGGDINYQSRERLDPTFYATAIKLGNPGKVSGIIKSQFGYHIIKLTSIRPWAEQDKAQVKRAVFEEQRAKIFEKYIASLKNQAQIVTHPELIKE